MQNGTIGGGGPSGLSFAVQHCMQYKSLCVELPKPPLTKPQPVEPPGDLNSTCSTRWICLASLPQRSRPIIGASPHRVAYPGTSKSSKARLIETHTNSLKHLLAKDGVIYKEAMAIVAEDIKKIISEEMLLFDTFLNSYSRPTRRPLRRSRSPHLPRGPNLAPARCPSTLSQSSLIDLCVEACP